MATINYKKDFPIFAKFSRKQPFIYLDSAATSQKPSSVIASEIFWYEHLNSNIHRGIYPLAERATLEYEKTRDAVMSFINAENRRSVVFTKGTTEGINIVAHSFVANTLKAGDVILLTEMEHHSNIVPWQMLSREHGYVVRYWPVNAQGELVFDDIETLFRDVKFLSLTYVSNILGTVNPIKKIIRYAHDHGVPVLVDAAQAVSHMSVNMKSMKPDFFVFSGHKMLGPTGIGILYVSKKHWDTMRPFLGGGDMVLEVSWQESKYKSMPWRFEAGTQALAQVFGLRAAIQYLEKISMKTIWKHQQALTKYAYEKLEKIPDVIIYGPLPKHRGALLSFNVNGIHAHDLATLLAQKGVCIRAGHHCAQPIHAKLKVSASARISFHIYNDKHDVDVFIKSIYEILRKWKRLTEKT